jgi:hypothetical protein
MKFETAAIHCGEKVAAQPRNQNYQRAKTNSEKPEQENTPMMETTLQQSSIALTESLEGLLKTPLKPDQRVP